MVVWGRSAGAAATEREHTGRKILCTWARAVRSWWRARRGDTKAGDGWKGKVISVRARRMPRIKAQQQTPPRHVGSFSTAEETRGWCSAVEVISLVTGVVGLLGKKLAAWLAELLSGTGVRVVFRARRRAGPRGVRQY